MVDWKVHKKKTEIRGFKRALKIPHGVILDKIKAKFNKEESILRISMPKSEKEMVGISVEDVFPLSRDWPFLCLSLCL